MRWTAPANDGGSPITAYRVDYSSDGGTTFTAVVENSTATTATIAGLTNGTSYVFRVRAINAKGTSLPSALTKAVVPAPATVPGAPTSVTATPGNASATVTWTAPASTGGSPITAYTISYSTGGGTPKTASVGAVTTATVTGLTNGSAYVFTVRAVNAVGSGPASAASAAVTPVADTSALAVTAPASVLYNDTATLGATLTDSTTGAALAGQPVVLFARHATSGSFTALKTVTTSSTGTASYGVKPNGYEQFYWRYAGTSTHQAVTSATKVVTVSQVVAHKVTASSVTAGALIQVYGTVSPSGSGQTIYLQYYSSGAWHTQTSSTIASQKLPDGTTKIGYILGVRPAKGTRTYRVYKPSTSTLTYGLSGQFSLTGK